MAHRTLTAVTAAAQQSQSSAVSRYLQNLYQHVLKDMEEEAAARRAGDLYADPAKAEP